MDHILCQFEFCSRLEWIQGHIVICVNKSFVVFVVACFAYVSVSWIVRACVRYKLGRWPLVLGGELNVVWMFCSYTDWLFVSYIRTCSTCFSGLRLSMQVLVQAPRPPPPKEKKIRVIVIWKKKKLCQYKNSFSTITTTHYGFIIEQASLALQISISTGFPNKV